MTRSTGVPPTVARVTSRMSRRSRLVTRGSCRRRWWSWPWPTSTATTEAAPAWSRQSVKPPVEAPASRARRPVGSMSKRSRAARELLAAPADEAGRCAGQLDGLGGGHQPRRLVGHRAGHQHPPLLDEGDGLGPTLDQPPLDQGPVEAPPRRAGQPADPVPAAGCRLLGRGLLGRRLLGRGLRGRRLLGRRLLGRRLLGRRLLGRRLLGRRLLGRPAFLAGAFLAGGLLGRPAVAARPASAVRPRSDGHLLGQVLEVGDAHAVELAGHLVADLGDQGLAALAAPLDQLLDLGLGVVALELAALDQLVDQLLGPGPGHVGEGDAGVEIPLECVLVGHRVHPTWQCLLAEPSTGSDRSVSPGRVRGPGSRNRGSGRPPARRSRRRRPGSPPSRPGRRGPRAARPAGRRCRAGPRPSPPTRRRSSNPKALLIRAAIGSWGLPAISGAHPGRGGHRGQQGARRRAPGRPAWDGSGPRWWPISRPESAGHRGGGGQAVEIERPAPADHGGHRRRSPSPRPSRPGPSRASSTPASASTLTDCPGSSSEAAARAEVTRSSGPASPRSRPGGPAVRRWSGPSCWWRTPPGPRGLAARRWPRATSPMGSPDSQITPSRSTIHRVAEAKVPLRRRRWTPARSSGSVVGGPGLGEVDLGCPSGSGGWRRPAGRPTRGPGR